MPKVSWAARLKKKQPPIDLLLGVIMERKQRANMTNAQLADIIEVHPQTIVRMMHSSSWDWKTEYKEKILDYFDVPAEIRQYAYQIYLEADK